MRAPLDDPVNHQLHYGVAKFEHIIMLYSLYNLQLLATMHLHTEESKRFILSIFGLILQES